LSRAATPLAPSEATTVEPVDESSLLERATDGSGLPECAADGSTHPQLDPLARSQIDMPAAESMPNAASDDRMRAERKESHRGPSRLRSGERERHRCTWERDGRPALLAGLPCATARRSAPPHGVE
jgi:hypothetical protein